MLLVPTAAPLALTAALLALNNHSDYSFLGMRYLEETQDAAFLFRNPQTISCVIFGYLSGSDSLKYVIFGKTLDYGISEGEESMVLHELRQ